MWSGVQARFVPFEVSDLYHGVEPHQLHQGLGETPLMPPAACPFCPERIMCIPQGDVVHERYYAANGCGLGREQLDRCLFVAMPSITLLCLVAILSSADRLDRAVPS